MNKDDIKKTVNRYDQVSKMYVTVKGLYSKYLSVRDSYWYRKEGLFVKYIPYIVKIIFLLNSGVNDTYPLFFLFKVS